MTGALYEDRCTFMISHCILLGMRSVSENSCRENENTYFVLSNFFQKNVAILEMMWKNTVDLDRPQMTI